MPRYRMKYEKSPAARFIGHLDTMKNFERAFRRAKLPIAFSQGFNPHPKISFASPLAVGVTGAEEFVDFHLSEGLLEAEIVSTLGKVMPTGFKILEIKEIKEELPALMSQIGLAQYDIEIPLLSEYPEAQLKAEVKGLLKRSEIEVERETKKGVRKKDIRSGVHEVKVKKENNKVMLAALLDSGSENNIRPEEIVKAIDLYTEIPIDTSVSLIHRRGVFIKNNKQVFSPMAGLAGEE